MTLDVGSTPKLARHARLRYDGARERWVLLAPERILVPDAIALDVLRRCDGQSTIGAIVQALAIAYQADPAVVENDVLDLLTELSDKRLVEA